jgi:hypothetical protein
MKRVLSVFIVLNMLQVNKAGAQDSTSRAARFSNRWHAQAGFNASGFIKEYLSFNATPTLRPSPYLLHAKFFYRYTPAWNFGIRWGYGFNSTFTSTNTFPATSSDRETTVSTSDMRIGLEAQVALSNRWTLYYGADYLFGSSEDKTRVVTSIPTFPGPSQNTEFLSSTTSDYQGFSPLLGIQFNINRYLSFSTEAALFFTHSKGKSTTTVTPQPQGSTPSAPVENSTRVSTFSPPTSINLNIMF